MSAGAGRVRVARERSGRAAPPEAPEGPERATPLSFPELALPIVPPYLPMEAERATALPASEGLLFEPKWDGFRCIAFRDGDLVVLQSKAGQPLGRYFPEVVAMLLALPAKRFVLDGELVVPHGGAFDFDALLQRVHPAESRIRKLAHETPAAYLVFDLLVDERGKAFDGRPLAERRGALERFASRFFGDRGDLSLSPATEDRDVALAWTSDFHGNIDGIVAKVLDAPYATGERTAMTKVKWQKTADCVIGGFRYAQKGGALGSILLGLYDDAGLLNHVGFCSSFGGEDKSKLLARLEALKAPPGFTGRAPGGPSRWSRNRNTDWEPVEPSLVVEVRYDHVSGQRFRHGTTLVRFRPDKAPSQCREEQMRRRGASASTASDRASPPASPTGRTRPGGGRRAARPPA